MNSLYARLALLLAAAFAAVGGLLVAATQARLDEPRLLELVAEVAIGAIVFALLAALCVFQLFTRRLQRVAAALEAYERGGGRTPPDLPDADPAGDEVARLAASIGRIADTAARQGEALDASRRQRGELLANVSHDLRTPLASMQGYLELLLLRGDGLQDAEARNYLQTAARQCERLSRRVGDLFELTRLDAEGVRPDLEDFALAELAHDVTQKFAAGACQRGVALGLRAAEAVAPVRVRADVGLVERLLASLVENALRHTPAGGSIAIDIEPAGDRVGLVVSDDGEGIAAADLHDIFERYDRAERVGGADRPGGHGGLGLAIARRIVGLHGGELRIESTPGRGTRIAFDLPQAAPAPAAARASRLAA